MIVNLKYIISLIILFSLQSSFASEIYTCTVNGKTVYQGKPCKGDGKTAGQAMREKEAAEQEKYKAEQKWKEANQIKVEKSESRSLTFAECKKLVLGAQLSIAGNYKTTTIVNAPQTYVARICTNDGSVLMTCNGPDRKLITTKSSYCP